MPALRISLCRERGPTRLDLLITGGTVVTCDDGRRILEDGAVAIAGDRIAAVGATDELARDYPDMPADDGRGLAVLPGFINAHTHTVLTALRGTVEDWDSEVIYRYMSPVSYTMSDHERGVMAALGCLEAIRSGTTTLVDPFRHVVTYAGAMADTGLRLWLSESCADIDTRRIRFGEYAVDEAFGRAFLERARGADRDLARRPRTGACRSRSPRMRRTIARPPCWPRLRGPRHPARPHPDLPSRPEPRARSRRSARSMA